MLGVVHSLKYHMLLNLIPKLTLHNADVTLVLPTYLNNHIAAGMINDYIFVYSLVSIISTLDYNFCTT